MSKAEKCTCKACKNPVFHCQLCKFVGFWLPSSSWLLKLPNEVHGSANERIFAVLFVLLALMNVYFVQMNNKRCNISNFRSFNATEIHASVFLYSSILRSTCLLFTAGRWKVAQDRVLFRK